MFPRIIDVKHVEDHRLELTFADGVQAELDFANRILGRGGVFTRLEDVAFFKQVRVDPEAGTVVWPNGVDFDPDVLYSEATGTPIGFDRKGSVAATYQHAAEAASCMAVTLQARARCERHLPTGWWTNRTDVL